MNVSRSSDHVGVLSDDALIDEAARRFVVPRESIRLVQAPYRICPLGAHIDHQLGTVTSMAIDQGVRIAFAATTSDKVHVESLDFSGVVKFSFSNVCDPIAGDWGNYPRGAVLALQKRFDLRIGLCGLTSGSWSEGGLSSSAAVGVALLMALEHVNSLNVPANENIGLDQAIENDYLGLRNGVLDQSAILLARRDHLTVLDCQSRQYQRYSKSPKLAPFAILIAFSGLQKALVGTDYNRRVEQCAAAAQTLLDALGRREPHPVLRHIQLDEYRAHRHLLSGALALRAEHFFSEQDRVERGIQAWQAGDLAAFGQLITQSGQSSIENYECGSPPLIDLYTILRETEGVLGTRFSGAGFRGCCIALVEPAAVAHIAEDVLARYLKKQPELAVHAAMHVARSDDGARFVR